MATPSFDEAEKLAWTFHPRVFSSLGRDLVTNDLVAMIELVKNGYDAFAHRVDIRFLEDERVKRGIDWIVRYQRFDDGGFVAPKDWPYAKATGCFGKHSCHMGAFSSPV
jgi:hypothetical protein